MYIKFVYIYLGILEILEKIFFYYIIKKFNKHLPNFVII